VTTVYEERTSRLNAPPHSLEAEESVLGAVLLSTDAANVALEKLHAEDFYVPAHQSIFEAITALFDSSQPIDAVTVSESLRRLGALEQSGGPGRLAELLAAVPTASNIEHYAGIVEEHALRRRLQRVGGDVTQLATRMDDDIATVLDRAEQAVFAVSERRIGDGLAPIDPLLGPAIERAEELNRRGHAITGLSTGFRDLDRMLAGLHPSNLMIVAARPGMGKCLVGPSEVIDAKTGALVTIGDMVDRDEAHGSHHVLALQDDMSLATSAPTAYFNRGVQETYTVTTRLGRRVVCTSNHPLRVLDGWREVADLSVGDTIAVPSRIDVFGVDEQPDWLVALVGYLLGAGSLRSSMPRITISNRSIGDGIDDIGEDIKRWATDLDVSVSEHADGEVTSYVLRGGSQGAYADVAPEHSLDPLTAVLRRVGLAGCSAGEKFVPEFVYRLPRHQVAMFLSRLYASGGSACTADNTNRIDFCSASRRLARGVQHLLLRFGIVAELRERPIESNDPNGTAWDVSFKDPESIGLFAAEIGMFSREAEVSQVAEMAAGRQMVQSASGLLPVEPSADIVWDPIVSIEAAGPAVTYDIEVAGCHNFVADDVVVHNSALALNMAQNVAIHEKPVAVFTLEMSREEVVTRMLCASGRIDSQKLRSGHLGESDFTKLSNAASVLYKKPIFVDDSPGLTVTEIRAKCRRMARRPGLSLVIVDYLQLMQGSGQENRQQEIAAISRSLKNLARELDVPVIALSQLNRSMEQREDKRPRLSDLRESGSLEQDADVVMFIYRHEYYHPEAQETKGIAEVAIAKHRQGATGRVDMTFLPEYTLFSDMGRDTPVL